MTFLQLVFVAVVYYLTAHLGNIFSIPPGIITPLWPVSGVKIALVLLMGYRIWPGIFFGAVIFELSVYSIHSFSHVVYACIIGMGETIEPVIFAWFFNKYTQDNYALDRVYHVFIFLLLSILVPIINAAIGTTLYAISGSFLVTEGILIETFLNWWLDDVIGIIIFAPPILTWWQHRVYFTFNKIAELLLLLILLSTTAVILFTHFYPMLYIFLPFAIWASLRFEMQIAVSISLLIAILIIVGTFVGYSELRGGTTQITLLLVQGFVGVIAITVLLTSSVLTEREVVDAELRLTNAELEERVLKRTHLIAEKHASLNQALIDLKKMQTQLVHSEKMSSVGVLATGIAHEINNSVNFISANLQPLKQDIDDVLQILTLYSRLDDQAQFASELQTVKKLKSELDLDYTLKEVHELLVGMQNGTERTTTIVKDLRTFSHLDESLLKKIDIHEDINSTLTLIHAQLKDRITVIKNYGNIPAIECYPGKINQVLMNLLMNAAQAIKDKGTIKIKTEAENNVVKITIEDSGSGMSPETLQKIFEPFFTTKDVGQGTGLGLWISYDIIQAHHGKIEVKSTLNVGTQFIITLPISQKT